MISDDAVLILQGSRYSGGEGYFAYKEQRTMTTDEMTQLQARPLNKGEIEVAWAFNGTAQDGGKVQHEGARRGGEGW